MGIVVIDGLGRYEIFLSSEAFGPCFRTRLAGAFLMCIWCPNCRLSNKFLIQFLFWIIATCSFTCRVWSVHSVWSPFSCGCRCRRKLVPHFLGLRQFKCPMASADPASGGGEATVAKAISRWAERSGLPRPWSVRYETLGASDRDAYRRWRDNSWSSRSSTRNGDSRDRLMWCQTNMGNQLECLTKVISATVWFLLFRF